MRFTLSIDLGSATMRTRGDVARALLDVADALSRREENSGAITDLANKRVGTFEGDFDEVED